jgi:hypothetical protein
MAALLPLVVAFMGITTANVVYCLACDLVRGSVGR